MWALPHTKICIQTVIYLLLVFFGSHKVIFNSLVIHLSFDLEEKQVVLYCFIPLEHHLTSLSYWISCSLPSWLKHMTYPKIINENDKCHQQLTSDTSTIAWQHHFSVEVPWSNLLSLHDWFGYHIMWVAYIIKPTVLLPPFFFWLPFSPLHTGGNKKGITFYSLQCSLTTTVVMQMSILI